MWKGGKELGGMLVGAEGLQGEMDQGLDVGVGIGVGEVLGGGGAVGGDGLVFAAELGVEVAADEMEDGIGRIFFLEGRGDFEGLLVFLVVVVEADREIEAGFDRRERAFGRWRDGVGGCLPVCCRRECP